jgi:hypothetical protein
MKLSEIAQVEGVRQRHQAWEVDAARIDVGGAR